MNDILKLLQNHRTIRKFTDQEISSEQVQLIVEYGQRASTSSYVMAYSIIGITDKVLKKELHKISGQPYVEENGYLFVICADLHRNFHAAAAENEKNKKKNIESTEQFTVAVIDAALVTQNMVIAAESLGLGACFLGSLRNNIQRTDELLALPEYVIPLFGLAIGYPDEQPEIKPRLPFKAIFHENKYNPDKKQFIDEFDDTIRDYYQKRSTNQRTDTWTNQLGRKYDQLTRMDVGPYIQSKNMNKQ